MRILKNPLWFVLFPVTFLLSSCWLYSFSGASIPANMKTVNVIFFENNAPIVIPTLSQKFTEALKNRIRNQSALNVVRNDADATFEGRITDYNSKPVAITGNERAEATRLTITVNVKYTNKVRPEDSFEQSFSRFSDFQGSNLAANESRLIEDINKQLTEDIFNRAFANW